MKTWAVRVTVELLVDEDVVATKRAIQGANLDHVALDPKVLAGCAAETARHAAKAIADSTELPR